MLLAKEETILITNEYSNILGHMCYSAYKLWNTCNYEKYNYKTLGLHSYPNWYYQKKVHKDTLWYKNLPSQTAQEVCKDLEEGWKSFFTLNKNGAIQNARPPKYKQDKIPITYMQKAIVHEQGSLIVRLSIPKQLKEYMLSTYNIKENYLFLKSKTFQNLDAIKQIRIYPPVDNRIKVIITYEIPDVVPLSNNGKYLSIDLGIHNFLTCYDNVGKSFIVGRKYLSICRAFDKAISKIQKQWHTCQSKKGIQYPKGSGHITALYNRKNHSIKDYLHKITRWIADYCYEQGIQTVIIGDIKNIRKDKNFGNITNQKLHSLPYLKVINMLKYKLALFGITLVLQEESYTSQCSPLSKDVSDKYAQKSNRKNRGLYVENGIIYNADSVGAYNIMRKYAKASGRNIIMPLKGLSNPQVIKVAV